MKGRAKLRRIAVCSAYFIGMATAGFIGGTTMVSAFPTGVLGVHTVLWLGAIGGIGGVFTTKFSCGRTA